MIRIEIPQHVAEALLWIIVILVGLALIDTVLKLVKIYYQRKLKKLREKQTGLIKDYKAVIRQTLERLEKDLPPKEERGVWSPSDLPVEAFADAAEIYEAVDTSFDLQDDRKQRIADLCNRFAMEDPGDTKKYFEAHILDFIDQYREGAFITQPTTRYLLENKYIDVDFTRDRPVQLTKEGEVRRTELFRALHITI